jgi:hypothetical protein
MVSEMHTDTDAETRERPRVKRERGNPNMKLQREGYSINPGGRRKHDLGAKELMGTVTIEVVEFWIATMRDPGVEYGQRMRASENIAWGFLGKPSQAVFAAHAHVGVDNLPADASPLDRLADAYAQMIGAALDDPEPPMVDITPSRSRRSLPAPRYNEREIAEVDARSDELLSKYGYEEKAEQAPRQRVRREPQERQRVRRPRS